MNWTSITLVWTMPVNFWSMNKLFEFASGEGIPTNARKIAEFRRLDKEVSRMEKSMTLSELFHSLEYALLKVRAKNIVKSLNDGSKTKT